MSDTKYLTKKKECVNHKSSVDTTIKGKILLTDKEKEIFTLYSNELVSILEPVCTTECTFNALDSLNIWIGFFKEKGYKRGERRKIITGLLDWIDMFKIYFDDDSKDILHKDLPMKDINKLISKLKKDPIYKTK